MISELIFKENPLDFAKFFDIDLIVEHEALDRCTEEILREIEPWLHANHPGLKVSRLIPNLKVILLNIGVAYLDDPKHKGILAYSRAKEGYPIKRYNTQGIRRRFIAPLADALVENGYLEHKKGFRDRRQANPDGIKYRSRMWASQKLIDTLFKKYKVPFENTKIHPNVELIQLKNEDKRLVNYRDTTATIKWRDFLTKYNKLLNQTKITPKPEPEQHLLLYRIFNNSSWKLGGRFYGGFWQQMNPEARRGIKINGHKTTELDYKALHPSILYSRKGLFPINIYERGEDAGLDKDFVKTTIFRMLNGSSKQSVIKSLRKDINEGNLIIPRNGKTLNECLKLIEDYHASISDYFYTGVGLKLQYEDSQVMEQILKHFTDKGILVLPIHDSCIIEKQHRDELEEIMIQEFKKQFKFEPRITHK